jgi:hypothetical protein
MSEAIPIWNAMTPICGRMNFISSTNPAKPRSRATSSTTTPAFIAFLQDVPDDGNATNITAGCLRAGLRRVDEEQSKQAMPVLPCNIFECSTDWPKGHIPYSVSAQCSTLQGRSQNPAVSHDGRPKQGCTSTTRISACFRWHELIQYGLFIVTIVAARGEVGRFADWYRQTR